MTAIMEHLRTSCVTAVARDFACRAEGNVAIIAAITMPVFLGLAALATDEGAVYYERRAQQNATDIAAMVAVTDLSKAQTLAMASLSDNGEQHVVTMPDGPLPDTPFDPGGATQVKIEKGAYSADPAIDPGARFQPGALPANAVKVTLRKPATLYFGKMFMDPPPMTTSAVAYTRANAVFSIGSRLARLEGGILNATTNALLGTQVSLDVMDYEALIDARVELLPFLNALATRLQVTGVTYDDLLAMEGDLPLIARSLASVAFSDTMARNALLDIANGVAGAPQAFVLSGLFDAGELGSKPVGSGNSKLKAELGVMEVLAAAASLANGSSQIAVDLGARVPGLLALNANLAIGEPPVGSAWFAYGEDNQTVRTAQTRLLVEAKVGGSGLLSAAQLRLPVYVELAHSRAAPGSITCSAYDKNKSKVELDVLPGLADAWIADVDTSKLSSFHTSLAAEPAAIVSVGSLKVKGKAHAEIADTNPTQVSFNYTEIQSGDPKTVSTHDFTASLTTSLLNDLELQVSGLTLGLGALAINGDLIGAMLEPAVDPLDNTLYTLLSLLGVKLGQADVWVHGVDCSHPVLVQ